MKKRKLQFGNHDDRTWLTAKNDDVLPVRLRKNGLWIRGTPIMVRIYKGSGELEAEWSIPSTALACILCEHVASLYLASPSRFSFISSSADPPVAIDPDCNKPLTWLAKFANVMDLQIILKETTEEENSTGEYGWRPRRNWRRLVEDKLAHYAEQPLAPHSC